MKFDQLYSGSSGNLYMITANNGKRLMLECGVTWAKLQKALDYDLSGIVACFVSHDHKDHCKAVKEVLQAGIDVYSSKPTFTLQQLENERRVHLVKSNDLVRLGTFEVLCFETNHDAAEPLGFVVRADNEFLLFATDTSHIKQLFGYPFSIIAIECSFDKEILERRLYADEAELKKEGLTRVNETLAKRLLTSHMEKQATICYLAKYTNLSQCTEIHLLHMSGDNIDKEKTRKEIENRFFIETKIV